MMVWKRDFLLNMAIFGIYVKFLGIAASHDRFSPKGEILYIYIWPDIFLDKTSILPNFGYFSMFFRGLSS